MPELFVESLALRITGATGSTGRIEEITLRALDLLGRRVDELGEGGRPRTEGGREWVTIDLDGESEAEVATAIADAWLHALRARLEG